VILEPEPLLIEPTLHKVRDALLLVSNDPDFPQWEDDVLRFRLMSPTRIRAEFGLVEGEAARLRDYLNFVLPPQEPKLREYVNRLFAQEGASRE